MRNYANGANFEREVKRHFEAERGAFVVRAAGSHGCVDLVVFVPGWWGPFFIQCKRNGKISPEERRELREVAERCKAYALVAGKPARGKLKFWQISKATNKLEEYGA